MKTPIAFLSLLGILATASYGQELALDLRLQAGSSTGSVVVELFPSNEESSVFRLSVRSDADEHVVTTSSHLTTLSNLKSDRQYTISAVGMSAEGDILETSPTEEIVAP